MIKNFNDTRKAAIAAGLPPPPRAPMAPARSMATNRDSQDYLDRSLERIAIMLDTTVGKLCPEDVQALLLARPELLVKEQRSVLLDWARTQEKIR